jgi:hypothetical protein
MRYGPAADHQAICCASVRLSAASRASRSYDRVRKSSALTRPYSRFDIRACGRGFALRHGVPRKKKLVAFH